MARYLSVQITNKKSPDAQALTPARLADWCRRFTPLSAADAPDGAMLDIAGAAHLFGGENALAQEIEARLLRLGYETRCALADTPEAAWALARFGSLMVVALFALIAVLSVRMVWDDIKFNETSPGIGVPRWWYTIWLPILSVAIALRALGLFIRRGRAT